MGMRGDTDLVSIEAYRAIESERDDLKALQERAGWYLLPPLQKRHEHGKTAQDDAHEALTGIMTNCQTIGHALSLNRARVTPAEADALGVALGVVEIVQEAITARTNEQQNGAEQTVKQLLDAKESDGE